MVTTLVVCFTDTGLWRLVSECWRTRMGWIWTIYPTWEGRWQNPSSVNVRRAFRGLCHCLMITI